MANEVIDFHNLTYQPHDHLVGVGTSKIQFNGCEAIVYKYPKGTKIPMHKHSDETLKVILSGKMQFTDGEADVGMMYHCAIVLGYAAVCLEETYMLLLQKPGTKSVAASSP